MIRKLSILIGLAAALQATAIDLTVDDAVRMALESNEQVRESANRVIQARLQQGIARTAYLPKLDGQATMAWMLPDSKYEEMAMTMSMRGVYMAGISVTQPIFAGGKIVAANKLAGIGRHGAVEQERMTRSQVSADAQTYYWNYVAVLSKIDMLRAYMAQVDTAYRNTSVSVKAGMSTETDLLRIDARRSQVAYQLEQVEAGANLCRMALCNAIGVSLDTPLEPADKDIPAIIPDGIGDYDLSARPEMQLLQVDVDAKGQQVNIVRADYLPQLGLMAGWSAYGNMKIKGMAEGPDGNYHPYNQSISSNGWNIMLSLKVPLFHWGEGVKKVKHAKLDVENARLELQRNRDLLDLQVRQAITNLSTGRELVHSAEVAMSQAQASLDAVEQRYNVGLSSLTELLDAQAQWHTSRSNLIESRTQFQIYLVDYRLATATIL